MVNNNNNNEDINNETNNYDNNNNNNNNNDDDDNKCELVFNYHYPIYLNHSTQDRLKNLHPSAD